MRAFVLRGSVTCRVSHLCILALMCAWCIVCACGHANAGGAKGDRALPSTATLDESVEAQDVTMSEPQTHRAPQPHESAAPTSDVDAYAQRVESILKMFPVSVLQQHVGTRLGGTVGMAMEGATATSAREDGGVDGEEGMAEEGTEEYKLLLTGMKATLCTDGTCEMFE